VLNNATVPESALMAAIGGLVAAIIVLFRLIMTKNAEHSDLSMRVGKLEGRLEGVEHFAGKVLETVERAVKGDDDGPQ
tara:strand:- start:10652 stop:10885 length:234 start_codon:yes stop_codon:yes gene_type:complete